MKTYVIQLISDIVQAHLPPVSQAQKESISFEEEMEAIEDYAEGRNIPPNLSIQCGLTPNLFPPEDQLNDEEIHGIIDAFSHMLLSRNIILDLPEKIPLRRAYPLIINLLNEEAWYFPTGNQHFDFCTGYAPDCELGEYCSCKEIWDKDLKEFSNEEG